MGYAIAPGAVLADGRRYAYTGRTLAVALRARDLPAYPAEATAAAKSAHQTAEKTEATGDGRRGTRFRFDTGTHGGSEAPDAVKLA